MLCGSYQGGPDLVCPELTAGCAERLGQAVTTRTTVAVTTRVGGAMERDGPNHSGPEKTAHSILPGGMTGGWVFGGGKQRWPSPGEVQPLGDSVHGIEGLVLLDLGS